MKSFVFILVLIFSSFLGSCQFYGLNRNHEMLTYKQTSSTLSELSDDGRGVFLKADGTKCYVTDADGDTYQYSLSTAWDISTLSYDSKSHTPSDISGLAGDNFISPDGTNLYVSHSGFYIHQYDLSTAWDISTASTTYDYIYTNTNIAFFKFRLNPTGTILYLADTEYEVNDYTVSTAFRISTASTTASNTEDLVYSWFATFNSSGSVMYSIFGDGSFDINNYTVSPSYDINGVTIITSQDIGNLYDAELGNSDTKMYIMDTSTIRQYIVN